jgi:hypothetical protein
MALPQDPQQQASAIDALASKAMGVEPQQVPQQAPQQAAPQAPMEETTQDKAADVASPQTEGDKIAAEAIIYEVDFGEKDEEGNKKKRPLTDNQIKATFERYSAMNHKNAQYKPVQDVMEQIAKANPNMSMDDMAKNMIAIYNSQVSNPTMGNTQGERPQKAGQPNQPQQGGLDQVLSKWEEDNAISLPPEYKNLIVGGQSEMQVMKQQLAQTQRALQQVLSQSQGVADAAKSQVQASTTDKVGAIKQTIANNLDKVQQALRLPDDKGNDFMVFAAERGFTLEDFVDERLTAKVMNDFKNNMDSPEMERMRDIASRRQAYTGSMGSTPSSSPAATPDGETTFDKMSARIMNKKGMA